VANPANKQQVSLQIAERQKYCSAEEELEYYNGPRNLDTKRGENKIDSRHDEKTV